MSNRRTLLASVVFAIVFFCAIYQAKYILKLMIPPPERAHHASTSSDEFLLRKILDRRPAVEATEPESDTLKTLTESDTLKTLTTEVADVDNKWRGIPYTELEICGKDVHNLLACHAQEGYDTCRCIPAKTTATRDYKKSSKIRRRHLAAFLERNGLGHQQHKSMSIIILTLNRGFLYLFLNWLCSLEKHGIDPRNRMLILFPSRGGDSLETKLRELRFTTLSIEEYGSWGGESGDWTRHLRNLDNRAAMLFGLGAHAHLNVVTFGFANDLVHLGYRVLCTDVDHV